MDMEGITTTLAGLVPTGKNLAWLLAAGVSMFFAGVGFTISAGEYRDLPQAVDTLRSHVAATRADVEANQFEISRLRAAADSAGRDRSRILCLLELSTEVQVSGVSLTPLQYNRRIEACASPARTGRS